MAKEIVEIAIANKGVINLDVEVLKTWVPIEINYFGDVTFFKHENVFYSMKRVPFKRIFNKE
jgi:hypothetical protein